MFSRCFFAVFGEIQGRQLGNAAYAQVLVLSVFMGGLDAGAWLAGRYGPARRRLLLGYAAAEGLIGIMALWFHEVFVAALAFAYDTVLSSRSA